jgi:CMP-N-acetylneuraminic acid synthetase
MKKVIVIPIKTNNQRLPGKNTMLLAGKPLYQYLFDTVKNIDIDVVIDCSDDKILNIAKDFNFHTVKRDPSLNSAQTSGNDLIINQIKKLRLSEDCLFGQFFVTTPFLESDTIKKSFKLLEETDMSSCFGIYRVYDRFWYQSKPVNHNFKSLVGTQYMNPLFREAGFYTFKVGAFLKERSRITDNFVNFEVDETECIDIDTYIDFMFAESYAKSRQA